MTVTTRLRIAAIAPALAGCWLVASPAASAQDTLLEQALNQPVGDLESWAMTRTLRVMTVDEGTIIVERLDPSKEGNERSRIISITDLDGKPLNEDAGLSGDNDVDVDLPSYGELRGLIENGIELIEENDETALYRVYPDENGEFNFGEVDLDDVDLDEGLEGRLVVDKTGENGPYVSRVSFVLPKSQGSLMAKIRTLNLNFAFTPEADTGAMLPSDFALDLSLSALLFIDVDIDIDMRLSDFTYVGTPIGLKRP